MPPDAQDIQQQNPAPTPEQITTAATAGPQPSLSSALTGAPATAPGPATAPAPARPTPQQQAAAADVAHHSMLGKAVSFLLGKQRQYVPDPVTGAPKAVDVPRKPGELFSHILAAAIIGGAAGQGTNSPIAGFTRGATAGIQANMQADAQKRAQAQRDFENRQAAERQTHEQSVQDQRLQDERRKTDAQLEVWNKETLLHERDANLHEREFIESHDERQQRIRDWATEQGAIDAPVPNNGELGNGGKFQKLFTAQPELFRPPTGYSRIVTTDVDMNGLAFDKDKGYVDAQGNAVDLKDRTTWHVQFIPHNSAKDPIEIQGTDLQRLFPKTASGLVKPDKTYRLPFEHVIGLAVKEHETNRREAHDDWRERHDEIARQLGEMKNRADNLSRQIDTLERQPFLDDDVKKQIADLTAQRQQVWNDYDAAQAQAHPQSKLRKTDSRRNANATPTPAKPAPVKVGDIKTVNGQQVRVTKILPKGKYEGEPVGAPAQ